jgi:hypothetical protein
MACDFSVGKEVDARGNGEPATPEKWQFSAAYFREIWVSKKIVLQSFSPC